MSRFLARPRWQDCEINSLLTRLLLDREASQGLYVFIVRQEAEQSELDYIAQRLETDGGIRKLKRILKVSVTREYRAKL